MEEKKKKKKKLAEILEDFGPKRNVKWEDEKEIPKEDLVPMTVIEFEVEPVKAKKKKPKIQKKN